MKKVQFIAVLAIFISSIATLPLSAQTKNYDFHRYSTSLMLFSYQPSLKLTLPVKSIEVIDARFDQTKLGVTVLPHGVTIKKEDLVPENNLSENLQAAFAKWFHFDPSSESKLVLIIRNFRISENIANYVTSSFRKEYYFQLVCAAYLQQEDKCYKTDVINQWYSSLNRLNNDRIVKDEHENFMTNVLLHEMKNLHFGIDPEAVVYSRSDIDAAIAARFNLPVLQQSPNTGIYRTFTDFLANKPEPCSFTKVTDKKGKVMLFDESGKLINADNAFAMYNGHQLFYFAGDYYYEMKRRGNFYEVKTYYKTDNNEIVSMLDDLYNMAYFPNNVRKAFRFLKVPEYLEVNMDTGELYVEELAGIHQPKELL